MGAEKGLLVPLERKCCKNDAAWCLESSTYMRSIVLTWRKTNLVCNLSLHLKKAHREFPGILKQKKKCYTDMTYSQSSGCYLLFIFVFDPSIRSHLGYNIIRWIYCFGAEDGVISAGIEKNYSKFHSIKTKLLIRLVKNKKKIKSS